MDFNKPPIVDLSKAIKIPNVCLNELLAQHAERFSELNVEDPAPAPHLVYLFASSVSDLLVVSNIHWLMYQAFTAP
jgi:hypothetical protein